MPLTEPTRLVLRKGWQPMDADAAAYISAVEAADTAAGQTGGLEERVKIAIDNFVLGCKADGIWTAIKASCILAGARTLGGALVPLTGTAPTSIGFVANDYDRKTGLLGGPADTPTRYLTVDYPNTIDALNKHMSVYCTQAPSLTSDRYMIGTLGNAYQGASSIGTKTTGYTDLSINTAYQNSVVGGTTLTGFHGAKRTNTTSMETRTGGVTTLHTSSYQNPTFISKHAIFGRYSYTVFSRTDARLAFYSIGEALDLAKLDGRVTDLINAFGVAIP